MHIYDLLDRVVDLNPDIDTYFFNDEDDVLQTLGGTIICGNVENSCTYLIRTDEHFDDKCDFIVDTYGTLHYAYKVEDD